MFSDFTMEELNRERASETEKELKTESEAGRENRVREGSAQAFPLAIQLTWSFINTAARLTSK